MGEKRKKKKLKSRVMGYHFLALDSVQKAVTDAIKTPNRS
jgi:hypothetical protein